METSLYAPVTVLITSRFRTIRPSVSLGTKEAGGGGGLLRKSIFRPLLRELAYGLNTFSTDT